MSIKSLIKNMFSIHGRASRSEFWWSFFLLVLIGTPLSMMLAAIDLVIFEEDTDQVTFFSTLAVAVIIAALAPVMIRRLHDRNKSGAPVVISTTVLVITYISIGLPSILPEITPYIELRAFKTIYGISAIYSLFVFAFVFVNAFIRGTVGPNSYGPDPLEKTDNAAPKAHINKNPIEESIDSPSSPTLPPSRKGAFLTASTVVLSLIAIIFTMAYYGDKKKDIEKLPKFNEHTATDSLTALGKTQDGRPLSPVFKSSNAIREDYPSDGASEFRRAVQHKKSTPELNTPSPSLPSNSVSAPEFFYKLCKSGTAEQIKQAIRSGINVNRRDAEGGTCLIWAAAFNQNKEAIKAILDAGADPLAIDKSGFTALASATTNRNPDVVALLTEAETKARRDAGNNTPRSPSKELIDGNVKIFRSLHHPKAHGLDFSMKYPESFYQKEDDRQNVIQRIMDKKSKHIVVIEVSLLPNDMPENDVYNFLKEEDNPEDFKEFINIEGSYMHYIGDIPARIYYGTSNQKTSFGKIKGASTMLFTIHNNNVIMITFLHLGEENSLENKALASLMINSIAFHD